MRVRVYEWDDGSYVDRVVYKNESDIVRFQVYFTGVDQELILVSRLDHPTLFNVFGWKMKDGTLIGTKAGHSLLDKPVSDPRLGISVAGHPEDRQDMSSVRTSYQVAMKVIDFTRAIGSRSASSVIRESLPAFLDDGVFERAAHPHTEDLDAAIEDLAWKRNAETKTNLWVGDAIYELYKELMSWIFADYYDPLEPRFPAELVLPDSAFPPGARRYTFQVDLTLLTHEGPREPDLRLASWELSQHPLREHSISRLLEHSRLEPASSRARLEEISRGHFVLDVEAFVLLGVQNPLIFPSEAFIDFVEGVQT